MRDEASHLVRSYSCCRREETTSMMFRWFWLRALGQLFYGKYMTSQCYGICNGFLRAAGLIILATCKRATRSEVLATIGDTGNCEASPPLIGMHCCCDRAVSTWSHSEHPPCVELKISVAKVRTAAKARSGVSSFFFSTKCARAATESDRELWRRSSKKFGLDSVRCATQTI